MADLIQLLPDAIANQIAAGEVIQRPASIVKELVENAVDAGSTEVTLIVKDAGKTLVQVIDNGCGMSATDARMSFERHATSKIRQADDLFAIRTMGFRGEALASIAAVAQVEMKTRLHAAEMGTRLVVDASEVKKQEPCQTAAGTSIAVKNLFYNVPARRNFLKSNTVEMRHVLDEFQRIALANPDVHFNMFHNDQDMFHLPPGNLRQRITALLGGQVNKKLVPVEEDTDILRLRGFVGKPEFARKTRGDQYFFVNDRYIKSGYLNHAVMTAFEEMLAKETYPLYVLFIDIDPARIDINVHPTKQEIKFDDERLVYNYLKVAVRHALGQYGVMPSLDFDQEPSLNLPSMASAGFQKREQDRLSENRDRPFTDTVGSRFNPPGGTMGESGGRQERNLQHWETLYRGLGEDLPGEDSGASGGQEELPVAESVTLESSWATAGTLDEQAEGNPAPQRPPYQVHHSYIVSHIKSGFILIDQQAAHERILYERYYNQLSNRAGATQQQLFPRTITLGVNDAVLLRQLLPEINLLGFDIEDFGQNAFVVNGLPAELAGHQEEEKLIEALVEQYKNGVALKLDVRENVARAMARSASIKRGQLLTAPEIQALIDQLFACAMPYRSPSGRSCFLTYELDELDKLFNR